MTLELARELRKRGHFPAIFSPIVGIIAQEARACGIPVTNKIESVGFVPDLIHGHHNVPLVVALSRFRNTPAIFVCHDSSSRFDEPLLHSQIKRYVAVDAACRERLIFEGVPSERVEVISNGVAVDVYPSRSIWSESPTRALLVVKRRVEHVGLVQEACQQCGLALEVVGPGVNQIVSDLPQRYRAADIVFAYSRSAMEAAATGAAVIIIDENGYGGMLGLSQIIDWPETTLSRRILSRKTTVDEICAAIRSYSPSDAKAVAGLLKDRADIGHLTTLWETIYQKAIETGLGAKDVNNDDVAFSSFLQRFLPNAAHVSEVERADEREYTRAETGARLNALFVDATSHGFDQIDFHKCAIGQVLLDAGWNPSEDRHTWSVGGRVSIWLPQVVVDAWDGQLCFICARYHPVAPLARSVLFVALTIEGEHICKWTFESDDPSSLSRGQNLAIPERLRPRRGGAVKITFVVDDAVSPLEAGDSSDPRVLGLSLYRVVPHSRQSGATST